ncbi:MAG: TonB-dependent receptor, partial [Myxococcales bacterium]|nr:TonB-dependent receptor [Myxococcales bacterium]
LAGLGAGAGVFGVGARAGDDDDSFELDAYTRVDVAAYYRYKMQTGPLLRAQVNVKNLADTEYYDSSLASTRVFPGAPRSMDVSFGVEF